MHLEENSNHLHFLTEKESTIAKKSLVISMFLSASIFTIELYGAIQSNSLSLLSDSFHIITDFFAHFISLIAVNLSLRKRTFRFNFGFLRFEILAAFINSILLLLMCIFLVKESIHRIFDPSEIHVDKMLAYSLVGLFINSLSAYILFRVSKTSINLKSTYLHVLGDLLGTFAVVVGALIIRFTGAVWVDSLFSFVIIAIIARATYYLLKETTTALLEASPDTHKLEHILDDVTKNPKLSKILSFKHWSLTSGVECFNLRVLIKDKKSWESLTTELHKLLKEDHGITHAIIEIVTKESHAVLESIQINHKNSYTSHGHSHVGGHKH
jgi:cobalt-zinc-cadmium efflux system protein